MGSQFTWTYDAPSGTYKNHFISNKLRHAAVAEAKFVQFCRPEPGFGKRKGEYVTVTRVSNMSVPTTAKLTEGTRIPIDDFSMSTTSDQVYEYGRGVEFSSWADDLSKFSLMNPIQRALKDQMKLALDIDAAAKFKTAMIIFIPTSLTNGSWETDGDPTGTATSNITLQHMGLIRDKMTDTYHVPFWEGDYYMGLASTKFLRGIKNDPEWQEWRKYLKPGDVLYNSEVGMVEGIRLVEVNHTSALSNAKGTGSVLGEAVIFGNDAVAMVEVETPHIRIPLPADAGRQKAANWYGMVVFILIWNTATDGEARIIRVTSA